MAHRTPQYTGKLESLSQPLTALIHLFIYTYMSVHTQMHVCIQYMKNVYNLYSLETPDLTSPTSEKLDRSAWFQDYNENTQYRICTCMCMCEYVHIYYIHTHIYTHFLFKLLKIYNFLLIFNEHFNPYDGSIYVFL